MITIFATFSFEGAHFLPAVPAGHKCGRLHGHNWTVELYLSGEPDEVTGWIVDFYAVEQAWRREVFDVIDHRLLNEIHGLDNPTTEIIVRWIWERLRPSLPQLARVVVRETPAFGAIYEGN